MGRLYVLISTRTPLPAYLKVCICHCRLTLVKGRRAMTWRTNGKRQVDAHIYHLHIWFSGISVGEERGEPSSPLIFLRQPPSLISGSAWLGHPLSEGLNLPLWVHIFASAMVSPYDQLIYTAPLLLWPHSFFSQMYIMKNTLFYFFDDLLPLATSLLAQQWSHYHQVPLYFVLNYIFFSSAATPGIFACRIWCYSSIYIYFGWWSGRWTC